MDEKWDEKWDEIWFVPFTVLKMYMVMYTAQSWASSQHTKPYSGNHPNWAKYLYTTSIVPFECRNASRVELLVYSL